MAGKHKNINTGASTAVNTVATPKNEYTQEFFLANFKQDVTNIEDKHSEAGITQYPLDIGRYYMNMQVSDYTRKNLMSVILNPKQTIRLPLPKQMVDSHGVTYEQKELGMAAGGATSDFMGGIKGGDASITSMINSVGATVGAAAISVADAFGGRIGVPVQDIARAASGYAPNQFLTILLKGPQYKKHQFSWVFSPRNAAESERLRTIIATLNEYMSPGIAAMNRLFTFPKVFQLSFSPTPRMLYRFLPAVIENMTINYAPSGPSFYTGTDAPSAIELTIHFLELEFWLSGRNMFQV